MGDRLAQGNAAVALLGNSLGTGEGLYALIGMFGPVSGAHFNPIVSEHIRPTLGEGLGEFVATFGLITLILVTSRYRPDSVGLAVAAFITSAYWFTSSTSFANPAVTLARSFTDTFAGIALDSVPLFLGGQALGGLAALVVAPWLAARS